VVTAQDGVTTDTYTLAVTRAAASTNDNLSNIVLSKGTLAPAFASATTTYSSMETNGTTSITVTPTTADATATITVNGTAVVSGKASGAITLAVGTNAITTIVTAQDGVTKQTYTVNVIRPSTDAKLSALTLSSGTLTPAFNTNTIAYTASVTNATASIVVTPTIAAAGATITVNGTAVASGTASAGIALAVGSNTITTVVTAQDGATTDTYTITVTRAMAGANDVYEPVSVGVQNLEPQLADDGINVHQGVSPNGDGINDYLQIDNISNFPDNNLKIMNRNGLLIYEAKGYDNSTRVFDGHSNKTGQMQLPGTYFYELDYTVSGVTKHKTGFLVLKY
jgi:gliding motility-associated-like protein